MSDHPNHLEQVANRLGIGSYRGHVLLCTGPNCCSLEEGLKAWDVLKGEIKARGLDKGENQCYRTKVGCLRVCSNGPILLVYPEGRWYHDMTAERIAEFVNKDLVANQPVESQVFATNPLPEKE